MMEIKFNPMRLRIIRKLRGLTIKDVEDKMMELGGFKNRMAIDRWECKNPTSPNSMEKVELLAKACNVPVGFFFYNAVDISMENLQVKIYIHETKEEINFNFLNTPL